MTKEKINRVLTPLLDSYQRHLKGALRPVERDKTKEIIEVLIYVLRMVNKRKEDNQGNLFL